jgi:PAS domain S-box-containing protein
MEKSWYNRLSGLMKEVKAEIGNHSVSIFGMLDEFPIGVALIDAHGNFERVNEQYCRIYQYQAEELIGQNFSILFPEKTKALISEFHTTLLETKEVFDGLFEVLDSRQNLMTVLAATSYIVGENSRTQRIALVAPLEDLAETENAIRETLSVLREDMGTLQSQLKASKTAESLMMNDLRSPLGNIIAMAKIIKAENFQKEERESWLNLIETVGKTSIDVIDKYSSLHYMEKGSFQPRYSYFNLVRLIHEVEDKLMMQLGEKGLVLYVKLDDRYIDTSDTCMLHADRKFIELMLSNLLCNAIEASPEYESITLDISNLPAEPLQDAPLQLRISNVGEVPEHIRPNFFEKFITAGKRQGAGMGTYIARSVVEAHDGNIHMSTSEREGTTITVTLPNAQKPGIVIRDVELRKQILG